METITVQLTYDQWVCGRRIVTGKNPGEFHYEGECGHGEDCCNSCIQEGPCPPGSGPFLNIVNSGCTDSQYESVSDFVANHILPLINDDEVAVDGSDVTAFLETQFMDSDCIVVRNVIGPDNTPVLQISLDLDCLKDLVTPEDVFGPATPCEEPRCEFPDKYYDFDETNCNDCDDDCKYLIPKYCHSSETPKWDCDPLDRPELETVVGKIGYNTVTIEQELDQELKYYINHEQLPVLDNLGWQYIYSGSTEKLISNGMISVANGGFVTHVPDFYKAEFDVAVDPDAGIHAWRLGVIAIRQGVPQIFYLGQHRVSATDGPLYPDGEFSMTPVPFANQTEPISNYSGVETVQASIARYMGRDTAYAGGLEMLYACTTLIPFVKISTFITNKDQDAIDLGRGKLTLVGSDSDPTRGDGSPFTFTLRSESNIVTRNKLLKRHGYKCVSECG